MKDAVYKISLDIYEHGSQAVLKAKTADTGRKLYITLRTGGTPYIIEAGCDAVFTATKPDGSILYNACTIEGNEIVYEFTEQTCTVVGRSRCEIKLYGPDGELITSPRFALLVEGVVYPDGKVESTSEFSALTKMVTDARVATEAANQSAADAQIAEKRATAAAQNAEDTTTILSGVAQDANDAAINANNAANRVDEAIEAVTTATNSANSAAVNANNATAKITRIVKNAMAIDKAEGTNITMDDAVELGFVGCRIFGKTTQDGTPTPDAPVDLVSIGDGGSITMNVTGNDDAQSMTITTPNGLPGIPVTSGGNYTDANGQQWICDEIDLARGVYVKRVNVVGFENAVGIREAQPPGGSNYRFSFYIEANPAFLPSSNPVVMCNALVFSSDPINQNNVDNAVVAYHRGGIFVRCDAYSTASAFVEWAISSGVKLQYALSAPTETPLSAEEIAAYSTLHAYRDHTTVSNDASAHMELEYVMDAKKYIDSLVGSGTIHPATVE